MSDDTSRPADDDVVPMISALAWQRAYCAEAGSPLAASLIDAVIDDLRGPGQLASLVPDNVRFGDLPGLRLMAVVHLLAIERRVPRVALHLPTLGGTPPAGEDALREWQRNVVLALLDHPDSVTAGLAQTPQTNETGRALLLRCVLSRLTGSVRLMEIGTSAGLNLRADHLPGNPLLEAGPMPLIVERLGCDRSPIDPTTQQGRSRLSSYVWVDDVERFQRLARAMDVAARVPARVVQADAADFAETLRLVRGTTTVVWHSAMWLYLQPQVRQRVLAAIDRLADQARSDTRLVHASWEWRVSGATANDPFELVWRRWGDGDGSPVALAVGPSHGPGARLLVPAQPRRLDPLVG